MARINIYRPRGQSPKIPGGTPLRGSVRKRRILDSLLLSIPLLTLLFIAVNPFPHTTAIAEISFYLTVFVLLLLLVFKKTAFTLQTPLMIPFGLLTAWSIFGLLFALDRTNSIHDIYAHLLKYLFFFTILVNFFNSRERFVSLIWTIITSSTVFGTWMMIHDYVIQGKDISTKLGLYTFSEMPSNIVGTITVFALLLALYRLKEETNTLRKFILVVSLCTLTIATLATQTMGTLLALFISLLLSFLRNKKIMAFFLSFLVLATLLLPVRDRLSLNALKNKLTNDDRLQISYLYGEIIKDFPVTGTGFGMQIFFNENLLAKYNIKLPPERRLPEVFNVPPHNLLIDVAMRLGLVGLMLFLFIIGTFIKMGLNNARRGKDAFIRGWGCCLVAAFAAIFIQGFFENTLSGPPAIILYTILGMVTILWRLDREDPEPA